jgi:hypothetical protein
MHALLATVQALSPNDLLLAISYTGERRELNLAADETLRTGAKITRHHRFYPMPCSNGQVIVCTRLPRSRPRAARRFPPPMRK